MKGNKITTHKRGKGQGGPHPVRAPLKGPVETNYRNHRKKKGGGGGQEQGQTHKPKRGGGGAEGQSAPQGGGARKVERAWLTEKTAPGAPRRSPADRTGPQRHHQSRGRRGGGSHVWGIRITIP